MARACYSATEVQTATTLGAAKSVSRKSAYLHIIRYNLHIFLNISRYSFWRHLVKLDHSGVVSAMSIRRNNWGMCTWCKMMMSPKLIFFCLHIFEVRDQLFWQPSRIHNCLKNGRNITLTKGQIISKAIFVFLTSSKKRTKMIWLVIS